MPSWLNAEFGGMKTTKISRIFFEFTSVLEYLIFQINFELHIYFLWIGAANPKCEFVFIIALEYIMLYSYDKNVDMQFSAHGAFLQ